ncbi:MAG: AMP-binding protein [Alphaproteobacteria bacterium]|jgi:cyclohexanecarboxylate-CoA ligase|nr:AMP-binding protein [Alphaproteobacteria bacterium]MDP6621116.1 AMP-binding protein [Alphaproteobacteria bacterium]|tara:strand:- start:1949 stop:3604 length:1656 start_codon:yes stop_codon:yes gene_type:complete
MAIECILPQSRIDAMAAAGHWLDKLASEYLDAAVAARPDHPAYIGVNSTTGETTRHSYAEFDTLVTRIALGLVGHGIGPGDVVSIQLPNWWQFAALHVACVRIGAVTNPLMPIFRQRELRFMLGLNESRIIFVPHSFRAFDYPEMIADVRPDLPKLEHVFAVCGEGENSFEKKFIERRWEDELDAPAIFAERRPGPNEVIEVLYTSGTTGEPKGVLHTANTLHGGVELYIKRLGLGSDDVVLMASPVAHQTGFLYGLVMPVMMQATSVLQDVWDPHRAAQLIAAEGVTFTMASTPFLADLTEVATEADHDLESLHTFLCAGAPIPPALVQRAREKLGVTIISCWGMSENGAFTTTRPEDAPEKAAETDGLPLDGLEVRVVDAQDQPLPAYQEGRLQARGHASFVGYLKRPELYGTDAEGWFETGDLAHIDNEGYIRITGRSKDVIIRGGENVPVVEVEELIYGHPAVQDVAVVAMPDERLGERGCAFVQLRDGESLELADLVAFLNERKIAKNYLPERLEIIPEFPRTPSGKIQKFKLREMAQELGSGGDA